MLLALTTPLILAYVAYAYDLRARVSRLFAFRSTIHARQRAAARSRRGLRLQGELSNATQQSDEQPLTGLDKEADFADGAEELVAVQSADADAPISSHSLMLAKLGAHFPEGDRRLR